MNRHKWVSSKYRRRAVTILKNSAHSLLLPLVSIIVSFLVIRQASVELWGQFVNLLIVVQFGAHIISWGNKEYLLREFSFNPAQIGRLWQTSMLTRLALFAGFAVVLLFWGWTPLQLILSLVWCLGLVLAQAHEVLVVYRRDFLFALAVELVGLSLMVAVVMRLGSHITLDSLILLFAAVHGLKAAVFLGRFRQQTATQFAGSFDFHYFSLAFPFFLLGFSGMLQSRVDLYAVNFFLSEKEVGQYQVFINFMLYLQAIANFVLLPFVKTIYRLSYETIFKISRRLLGFGLLIVPPALWLLRFGLTQFYDFNLPLAFYVVGGFLVIPLYFYLPIIYALYKADLQRMVLQVNILGTAVNFGLNLILLPLMGLIGALVATAVTRWLVFGIYVVQGRLQIRRAEMRVEIGDWRLEI